MSPYCRGGGERLPTDNKGVGVWVCVHWVYVCMRVFDVRMYVCMCVCVYGDMVNMCMCARVHVCMCVCVYA